MVSKKTIGNPSLCGICKREALLPLDESTVGGRFVLEFTFNCALQAEAANRDIEARKLSIARMEDFVLHSLEDQYQKRLANKGRKEIAQTLLCVLIPRLSTMT